MLYRHQLRPMISPQTKVTLYRHNLRSCTATNQGQVVSPHTKSKLYRKNLSQNCSIFYHCWGTRDNEWQGLNRSNLLQYWTGYWMFQTLYSERLNLHSLFWDFLSSCGISSFVCGFSSHSRIFHSYGEVAVTYLKYWRYGVKRYPINQMVMSQLPVKGRKIWPMLPTLDTYGHWAASLFC